MATGSVTMVQGSAITLPFRAVKGTTAIDISAATEIVFAVYTQVSSSATASFSKKLSTGIITLPNGGGDGRYEVPLVASDTSSLNPGNYEYQTLVTIGSVGRKSLKGTFTISAGADLASL